MLYSCPNHELSREIIIQKIYAWLSLKKFMVCKSNARTPTPPEKIKFEPSVAMVKDLLVDNIDGHVIYFCDEAARIARPDAKKHRPVVGMPFISVKIGYHCYHGLCDMGASASAIPHSLCKEIMHDIAPAEIEEMMLQLSLPIEILFHQLGLLEMLKSCVEKLISC